MAGLRLAHLPALLEVCQLIVNNVYSIKIIFVLLGTFLSNGITHIQWIGMWRQNFFTLWILNLFFTGAALPYTWDYSLPEARRGSKKHCKLHKLYRLSIRDLVGISNHWWVLLPLISWQLWLFKVFGALLRVFLTSHSSIYLQEKIVMAFTLRLLCPLYHSLWILHQVAIIAWMNR